MGVIHIFILRITGGVIQFTLRIYKIYNKNNILQS